MANISEWGDFPAIHDLFCLYNSMYFFGKLSSVEVIWSKKMTLSAGLCLYQRGGYCSIRLSEPLLKYRELKDLQETLLHEMIHAYLFLTKNKKDHSHHGPEFRKHMLRINSLSGLNITIYHNFKDEVEHYRQHIWRCDGVCQNHPPFFGYIRRSMNRAPGPHDPWWEAHKNKCGGRYIKISEPDNTKQSKSSLKDPKQTKLFNRHDKDDKSIKCISLNQQPKNTYKTLPEDIKTLEKSCDDEYIDLVSP